MVKTSAVEVTGGYDPFGYFVDQVEGLFAEKAENWEKQIKLLLDILNRQQKIRQAKSSQGIPDFEGLVIEESHGELRQLFEGYKDAVMVNDTTGI